MMSPQAKFYVWTSCRVLGSRGNAVYTKRVSLPVVSLVIGSVYNLLTSTAGQRPLVVFRIPPVEQCYGGLVQTTLQAFATTSSLR